MTPKPLFDSEAITKQRHTSSLFHSLEGTSTVNLKKNLLGNKTRNFNFKPTDLLSTGSILGTNLGLTGGQSYAPQPDRYFFLFI